MLQQRSLCSEFHTMWKKSYGKTGKEISVIGFGGMRFAKPEDLDLSAAIVHHAHARGINYFDTAPYYCDDRSEIICGHAFKTMPRDSYYVSTKCGVTEGPKLRESLERSLTRLNVDHIDFFHIWCLLRPEQLQQRILGGAIAAAQKAKEEGLIRHLVVSAHMDGGDISGILDSGLFEGITLGYNAINFPYREAGVASASRQGLGVVTMNPLGGGVIPANAERLAFLMAPGDKSIIESALRFNISNPAITSALVGFSTIAEVDQAIDAVQNFTPYPAEHIQQIKEQLTRSFDGICTGCGYCLPCPASIEIPKLMDVYNQRILGCDDPTLRSRLKDHWSISPDMAAACMDCGACESSCTQHLPIMERLKGIAALAR
jgi:hypothetical protein